MRVSTELKEVTQLDSGFQFLEWSVSHRVCALRACTETPRLGRDWVTFRPYGFKTSRNPEACISITSSSVGGHQ